MSQRPGRECLSSSRSAYEILQERALPSDKSLDSRRAVGRLFNGFDNSIDHWQLSPLSSPQLSHPITPDNYSS